MKYLVTGAAGHLGSTIIRKLIEQNKKVRALILTGDKNADLLPSEIEIFEGDVTNIKSLEPFFDNQGEELTVIHAAGIVSIASKYSQLVYDVNVNGTKNVVKMCAERNVKKMVHISSVHAIPELAPGGIIKEISSFNPDNVSGLYAKTKAEATATVLSYANQGLDVSIVHPSGILGPGDNGRGHITQLLIDCAKGRLTAGITGGYDFVDVRDVADGIITCCDKGIKGNCYILSNKFVCIKELLDYVTDVMKKKKVKTILPMWFAKFTAPLAETYYKILKRPPLFTSYSLYTLTSNAVFSHEKATAELNYNPRPLKQTIFDTITWLKGEGKI